MSERLRLQVLGQQAEPQPSERAQQRAAGDHPVIALLGDDAEVLAFATVLVRVVSDSRAIAAVVPAYGAAQRALAAACALHVVAARDGELDAFCRALPERAPIVTLGPLAELLVPSLRVGIGRARNAPASSYDLWLGYSYERVAHALGAVLIAAR